MPLSRSFIKLVCSEVGNRPVRRDRSLADQIQRNGSGAPKALGLQRALTHQGETRRRFFLEGSAGAVDPGDHGYAIEPLPDPHGGLDLLADAQIFPALDHHRGDLLGKRRRVERGKIMFLSRFQLLGGDVGFEGGREIRRLTEGQFPGRDMAGGLHGQDQFSRRHPAPGVEFYVIRLQHEVEFLEGPFRIDVHVQLRGRFLGRAHELEPQQRTVLDVISLGFGRDGLAGVADLLAAVENSPPLLNALGYGARAVEGDRRRRGPELALDQQNIHQAPEKHDAQANGALNKHAVNHYAKCKERPIQRKNWTALHRLLG